MDHDSWINAKPYGQLKTGNGSLSVTHLNWTGARLQWAGGSSTTARRSAYNVTWWNYPGTLVGKYPISGRTIW